MRVDVLSLQSFYAGPLGQAARAMVGARLSSLWPDVTGMDVLGFGYATPVLDGFRDSARRTLAFMPAAQGVEKWPADGPIAATIGEEDRLPFADAMFDRIVLIHALEEALEPRALLREVWRILAPEGRLAVVVANRRGLWANAEATPFGHGRPYTKTQLANLLQAALFQPTAWARALYAPPLAWPIAAGAADNWEAAGEKLWPALGGVLLAEAVKRLYIEPGKPAAARVLMAGAPVKARF